MQIQTTRFGMVEVDDGDVIRFPAGIIGFSGERSFVLLRRHPRSSVGWLQSTTTAWFALPVVSVAALAGPYSAIRVEGSVEGMGVDFNPDTCAIMVVLHVTAAPQNPTVNLVAPIVINSETRVGAQILIDGSPFSTQEPFVLRTPEPSADAPVAAPQPAMAAAVAGA